MNTLEAYLTRTTEEGDSVNTTAAILPGPAESSVRDLSITHQDARVSRLGGYYEIHGRYGLITLIRGKLDILLDGCPLHLSAGQGLLHFPFQTHYLLRESTDALLCSILFTCTNASPWQCLHRSVFRLPKGWENQHTAILKHWHERNASAAVAGLIAQLTACTAQHRQDAAPMPGLFTDLHQLLERPGACTLRVKELAASLNLSPNYLNSAYRTIFGAPLGTYLEHRRFDLAVSLLGEPSLPIKEIAERTGFLTTSSFCRKMRTWSGLTPSQCREILCSASPCIRFTPRGQAVYDGYQLGQSSGKSPKHTP